MKRATVATTGNEATACHGVAAGDVVRRLNTNTANGLDAAEAVRGIEFLEARPGPARLTRAAKFTANSSYRAPTGGPP